MDGELVFEIVDWNFGEGVSDMGVGGRGELCY